MPYVLDMLPESSVFVYLALARLIIKSTLISHLLESLVLIIPLGTFREGAVRLGQDSDVPGPLVPGEYYLTLPTLHPSF